MAHQTFSEAAWAQNAALYETIRTMPFNAELTAGTLSRAQFEQYMIQDAHYLIGFGRALSLVAAKAPHADTLAQFSGAAREAIIVERALHGSFFADWGITPETFESTPVSPGADHYISYLVATAWSAPYEVCLGAVLPCFWIYAEVGKDIHARAAKPNPYQAWIDTYAGEEFHEAVRGVIAATDAAAADASESVRADMHAAFTKASKLEWLFWDSAYRLETWPV